MRKWTGFVLAACMALSLSACGQSQPAKQEAAPQTAGSQSGTADNSGSQSGAAENNGSQSGAAGNDGNQSGTAAAADLEWLKGKNITIIVPFKAGGSLDLMVRAFVPYWEQEADCTFVVENREGASGQVGTTYFTGLPADMTSIYCGTQTYFSSNIVVNGASFGLDDFAMINMQQMDPTTLTVLQSSPYNSAEDLIQAIKDNPGKLKCGTIAGSAGSIMLNMLKEAYDLDFKIVTYDSGNDFRTALLGNHVDFIPGSANGDLGLGDEAKVLVVCGSERNQIWPDTPCTDEVWPELAIPGSLGSCRFFSASAKAAEAYPERFLALLETYEKAFNNADYQKSLEDSGELYVSGFYGPEESTELNASLHSLIEQYKDVLSEN